MSKERKRIALYARVSTVSQTCDNQLGELRAVAERMGWEIRAEYVDHGISGAKGREHRPAFDRMLKAVARREVDLVAAWAVDRLGRSLQDLVGFLGELHATKIDLYLHQQGINTTTPAGKAFYEMLGVFAGFERAMIQERVRAGLQRARAQGKTLGRPKAAAEVERQILELRAAGCGKRKIATQLGIGVSVVQRVTQHSEPGATLEAP